MVKLYPIVKLNEPSLLKVWQGQGYDIIVVRVQDIVSLRTGKPNSTFYKIKECGGVHDFLGFDGKIILSLIMKDDLIAKFDEYKYADIINTLKPDFYTTVDAETYDQEFNLSKNEVKRCSIETARLKNLCPNSSPIGQVKGSCKKHLYSHIQLLKSIGIKDFVFHVGDFFRNGSPSMISKAKDYALFIKKNTDSLILYGMGCQKKLLEFCFADAYVTFNHFVKAVNGKKYSGTCEYNYGGGYKPEIVKANLDEIAKNIKNMQFQKKLFEGGVCPWEADTEVVTDQALLELEEAQTTD